MKSRIEQMLSDATLEVISSGTENTDALQATCRRVLANMPPRDVAARVIDAVELINSDATVSQIIVYAAVACVENHPDVDAAMPEDEEEAEDIEILIEWEIDPEADIAEIFGDDWKGDEDENMEEVQQADPRAGYSLGEWKNPATGQIRIYVNHPKLSQNEIEVWIEESEGGGLDVRWKYPAMTFERDEVENWPVSWFDVEAMGHREGRLGLASAVAGVAFAELKTGPFEALEAAKKNLGGAR